MTETLHPLGRVVEHDEQSRAFPYRATAPKPVTTRTWRRYGPTLDQGSLGSCTGNAFTHAMNSKPNHVIGTTTHREPFAVEVYGLATVRDQFAGEYTEAGGWQDTGSSALGIGKAATEMGLIREYRWAFGFDHVLQALMDGPVMIGTEWRYDMFRPDSAGFVRPTGDVAGGHEYLLVGVDLRHRYLTFQNSWGPGWGMRGRFRMTFEDFAPLLAARGDAMIPVGVGAPQ